MDRVVILLSLVAGVLIIERSEVIAYEVVTIEWNSECENNITHDEIGPQGDDIDLCILKDDPEYDISVCDRKTAANGVEEEYCISNLWLCDCDQDCFDGSDETDLACELKNEREKKRNSADPIWSV